MKQQELFAQASALLRDVTPLKNDCGMYCDHACCKTDEDDQGGVQLFPGEKEWLKPDWGHMDGDVLYCDQPCDRDRRPFGCRIFPLTPCRKKDGSFSVRMDSRAWAMCPLMQNGIQGLQPEFVEKAKEAITLLVQDPEMRAFLLQWIRDEREYAKASL